MTGIVGALLEAWDELKIHRLRVLLSLIGVAVSVAAMTGVSALITTTDQVQREMMEKEGGREGSVTVWLPNDGREPLEWMREANSEFAQFTTRNEVRYSSRNVWSQAVFTGAGHSVHTELMVVDQPYGIMHRLTMLSGTWFGSNDDDRLAPSVIVNEAFIHQIGLAGSALPTAVEINLGEIANTVVVGGVIPDRWEHEGARAFILNSAFAGMIERGAKPGMQIDAGEPELEMWVGPDNVFEAERAVYSALGAKGASVMIQDYSWIEDSSKIMGIIGFTVTGLVLGLAALNLLTISMVTLRSRIREIGIRRAFGATSGRVFFAVMMETVVATVLAGAVGVLVAAVAFNNLPVDQYLTGTPTQDAVAFPVQAAVLGMVVAAGVGALAGLIPALVAVRVKPIDAIRF